MFYKKEREVLWAQIYNGMIQEAKFRFILLMGGDGERAHPQGNFIQVFLLFFLKKVIICPVPHAGCVSPLSVFLYHG